MRTPRGYRRLANGLLKKSSAGGRKRKAGRKRKVGGRRKQRGRGHKRGHKGRGVGYVGLRAGQAAIKYGPQVAKALAPFVLPVIGDAVAKGLKKVLNPKKKKGSGLRRHGGGLKRHGIR